MRYVEAPDRGDLLPSHFLAGGITDCPDWQAEFLEILEANYNPDVTIYNPRREDFPIDDPNASFEQIHWEFEMLRKADTISFWFSKETLCPIVLYELGAWSMTDKKIFVGVDPGYKRLADVKIQTALVRPDVNLVYTITELAHQVGFYL